MNRRRAHEMGSLNQSTSTKLLRILRLEALEPREQLSATTLTTVLPDHALWEPSVLLAGNVSAVRGPTVAKAAVAGASTVTGTTTSLSVLGADAVGESKLVYSWTTTAYPSGTKPTFSVNGKNAAKTTTVTFYNVGTYTFTAKMTDPAGLSATSSVTVVVSQAVKRISLTPASVSVYAGGTQQFAAAALDQFGKALEIPPSVTWSTTAGSIDSNGLLTAPAQDGSVTVTATSGAVTGSARVTVKPLLSVAKAAAAASSTVTRASTTLSVLGDDVSGESGLVYSWTTASLPSGAAAPIFSINGTNAAKNTTVTFGAAGTYTFLATITDLDGRSTTSSVRVTVSQTLASINVTPSIVALAPRSTQQFSVVGLDQFGNKIARAPSVTWTTTAGKITKTGLLTAPNASTRLTVTATSGTTKTGMVRGTSTVSVGQSPIVSHAAAAAESTVTGTSTTLSVLGMDGGGESGLIYTWSTSSQPSGAAAPTFSSNATNAAKNTTVTFAKAGTYTLVAKIANRAGRSVTSSVTVVVSPTFAQISVSPSHPLLGYGATQQFAAAGLDQFGNVLDTPPSVTWSTTAGSIDSNGLLTAPSTDSVVTVTATSGSITGTGVVTVDEAPTLAMAADAAGSVTGTSTTLSVLGADSGGEAGLVYSWSTTAQPSGAAATFAANGSNAAKNTTVTFSKAGTYTFLATITDSSGLSVTSSVTVVVSQTLTEIDVTPSSISMAYGATHQFAAVGLDQFGNQMASPPSVTWSTTAGSISSSGLLTAPSADGSLTVTATAGLLHGTASVSVSAAPFLGLNDAALAQLTQSLDADGSISRDDMIQILHSFVTGGTLSAADFADLQTIISNATMLNMPDYVRVLSLDVIAGNAANAHFRGQTLGNLAAGSSSTQLDRLIDKWFFGADHPEADAANYYNGGQDWGYQMASGSLFVGIPSHLDEHQGQLGDCYFITSLGSVADRSPTAIQNMFLDNGDNTWTVRFYANGVAEYVTVDRMLPVDWAGRLIYSNYGSAASNSGNALWISLAEKAYAQWNETGHEGRDGTNRYSSIEGGWMNNVYTQTLGCSSTLYGLSGTAAQATLVSAMNNHMAVSIGTTSSSSLPYGLYGSHAYAIIGYNSSNGTFTLYNPWGTDQPTGALTWAQLQQTCTAFAVADPSGSTPISAGMSNARVAAEVLSPSALASLLAPSHASSVWGSAGHWSTSARHLPAVDAYFDSLC